MNEYGWFLLSVCLFGTGLISAALALVTVNLTRRLLFNVIAVFLLITGTLIFAFIVKPIWILLVFWAMSTLLNIDVMVRNFKRLKKYKVPLREEEIKALAPDTQLYYKQLGVGKARPCSLISNETEVGSFKILIKNTEQHRTFENAYPYELFWQPW